MGHVPSGPGKCAGLQRASRVVAHRKKCFSVLNTTEHAKQFVAVN